MDAADLLKLWGGPALTYPLFAESIWFAIEASAQNSFTLIDTSSQIIGFGQTLLRETRVHLASPHISPACRMMTPRF